MPPDFIYRADSLMQRINHSNVFCRYSHKLGS